MTKVEALTSKDAQKLQTHYILKRVILKTKEIINNLKLSVQYCHIP